MLHYMCLGVVSILGLFDKLYQKILLRAYIMLHIKYGVIIRMMICIFLYIDEHSSHVTLESTQVNTNLGPYIEMT